MDAVVGKLGSGVEGRVKLLPLDVTSQQSVDQAFQTVSAEHGTVYGVMRLMVNSNISFHINFKVINNAGGIRGSLRSTIDLNTYGVRRVCEAFAPIIQDGGRIVQVHSAILSLFLFVSGFLRFCTDVRGEVQP